MSEQAAIEGDYTDLRFVKGRKVVQVVVEIPIERGEEFVRAFGTPNPATGTPVALARILPFVERVNEVPKIEKPKPDKPRRSFNELSRAQQAGIACGEQRFQRFLMECHRDRIVEGDAFAEIVRRLCGVTSRADLDTNSRAGLTWDLLYSEYLTWLKAPEVVG